VNTIAEQMAKIPEQIDEDLRAELAALSKRKSKWTKKERQEYHRLFDRWRQNQQALVNQRNDEAEKEFLSAPTNEQILVLYRYVRNIARKLGI
jgi:hypothetical protein